MICHHISIVLTTNWRHLSNLRIEVRRALQLAANPTNLHTSLVVQSVAPGSASSSVRNAVRSRLVPQCYLLQGRGGSGARRNLLFFFLSFYFLFSLVYRARTVIDADSRSVCRSAAYSFFLFGRLHFK